MKANCLIILTQTSAEAPLKPAYIGTDREDFNRVQDDLREDGTFSAVYVFDNPHPRHFITPQLNGNKPKPTAEEKAAKKKQAA